MTNDFFTNLQQHSNAKLEVLNKYVIPWMRKVILNRYGSGKGLIIDGFAGKGFYGDTKTELGSPLLLLQTAITFSNQAKDHNWKQPDVYLLFIENDKRIYEELLKNIKTFCMLDYPSDIEPIFLPVPNHNSIKIAVVNDSFSHTLDAILDQVPNLIPSFCFIDPFGFSQTPFALIKRFLEHHSSEILLNFIFEETNRFINHPNPKIQEQIEQHYGIENIKEIRGLIEGKKGTQRKELLVDFYSRQLLEQTSVKHVLNFEIKKNGRTKLILYYGTKSREGLKLMKKVMWKVDDTGSYLFDDRKNPDQIEFFFPESDEEQHFIELSKLISDNFQGTNDVLERDVEDFVLFDTKYPSEGFFKKALKRLEEQQLITNIRKIDGTNRRKGAFSNVLIDFI